MAEKARRTLSISVSRRFKAECPASAPRRLASAEDLSSSALAEIEATPSLICSTVADTSITALA
ncbi:hypothetical protein D3C72_2509630 [compost metagenome]